MTDLVHLEFGVSFQRHVEVCVVAEYSENEKKGTTQYPSDFLSVFAAAAFRGLFIYHVSRKILILCR